MSIEGYLKAEDNVKLYHGFYAIVSRVSIPSSLLKTSQNNAPNSPVSIIVKQLHHRYNSEHKTILNHEFNVLRSSDHPNIIKLIELQPSAFADIDLHFLCFEDFGGKALNRQLQHYQGQVLECLKVFVSITKALQHLHSNGILHKDISSQNIVANANNAQVKLIDFGSSSYISLEQDKNYKVSFEGTPVYMAPEQTGRLNIKADERSDLYSLGIVLYELITGQLPFVADDTMGIFHAHIARKAPEPKNLQAHIPQIFSDLIMKCIKKDPNKRYQSANVLLDDLERIYAKLKQGVESESFPLASTQQLSELKFSNTLYGRKAEKNRLTKLFYEFKSSGHSPMILIGGYSGIGKSALVQELFQPLSHANGIYISGKFDQYNANGPLSALIEALAGFIDHLLAQKESILSSWRHKLLEAIGADTAILYELLPQLRELLQVELEPRQLPELESTNRFRETVKKLLLALCSAESPLVVFLDDLQWADQATLEMIKYLALDEGVNNIQLIGAYRDHEVSESHPLHLRLSEIKRLGGSVESIFLAPLKLRDIEDFLSDLLNESKDSLQQLANCVHQKSAGNPFFVKELLQDLLKHKLLYFDYQEKSWQWHIEGILNFNISSDLGDFMKKLILEMPCSKREILQLASCIGTTFDFSDIASVMSKPKSELFHYLSLACTSGKVKLVDDRFRLIPASDKPLSAELKFSHDKIRQAAYVTITKQQREAYHLKLARLFARKYETSKHHHDLFQATNQIKSVIYLLEDKQERIFFTELMLKSAKHAKKSSSFKSSLTYLEFAKSMLESDYWQRQKSLALSIHIELAISYFLNAQYVQADELYKICLSKAKLKQEKIKIYLTQIMQYTAQGRYALAVSTGSQALQLCNIRFPKNPNIANLLLTYLPVKLKLRKINLHDKVKNTNEINEDADNALKILSNMSTAAYVHKPASIMFVCIKAIEISIKHGSSPVTGFAYTLMAFFEAIALKNINNAKKYIHLAKTINEHFDDINYRSKILYVESGFLQHLYEPMNQAFDKLILSYESGLKGGDLNYANYALFTILAKKLFLGHSLDEISSETDRYSEFALKVDDKFTVPIMQLMRNFCYELTGKRSLKYGPIDQDFNIEGFRGEQEKISYQMGLSWLCVSLGMISYFHGDFKKAKTYFDECFSDAEQTLMAQVTLYEYYFYYILSTCKCYSDLDQRQKLKYRIRMKSMLNRLRYLNSLQKGNFHSRYKLALIQYRKTINPKQDYLDDYLEVWNYCKLQPAIHIQALTAELCAIEMAGSNRDLIANSMWEQAYNSYLQWGALRKCEHIQNKIPYLNLTNYTQHQTIRSTQFSPHELLDFKAILRLSSQMTKEINFNNLTNLILDIIIENAGAQQGTLYLNTNAEELSAVASRSIAENGKQVSYHHKHSKSDKLLSMILSDVIDSHSTIVINDTSSYRKLEANAGQMPTPPQSVLALILKKQDSLFGVIYLEHTELTNIFSRSRVSFLEALCNQAVIAIDNSLMYKKLEVKTEQEKSLSIWMQTQAEKLRYHDIGEIASLVIHDLIGPMHAVKFCADQLASGEEVDVGEYAQQLKTCVKTMIELTNNLRNYIRPQSNAPLNAKFVVAYETVLDIIKFQFSKNNINHIKFNLSSDIPKHQLDISQPELNQILVNIISNSVQNLLEHDIKSAYINIKYGGQKQSTVYYFIEDSGTSLAQNDYQLLKEASFRTRHSRHAGIGLYLTSKLIEAYGGQLQLEPGYKVGTCFRLTLPIQPNDLDSK